MGFWGSLGKGLLKAAPIAASFIPGVGPLAAMGIGAATGAIGKKIDGGSWKDAIGGGLQGAATGYAGAKGLGPGSGIMDKIKAGLGGGQGMINTAQGMLGGGQQPQMDPSMQSQGGGIGPSRIPPSMGNTAIPREQQNMNMPNLGMSIAQGRRQARMGQAPPQMAY